MLVKVLVICGATDSYLHVIGKETKQCFCPFYPLNCIQKQGTDRLYKVKFAVTTSLKVKVGVLHPVQQTGCIRTNQ